MNSANPSAGGMMLRDFPFPFASALSIVSDVDGSTRPNYVAYVGQLVHQLGLDFGDSAWLAAPPGLGILSRDFTIHGATSETVDHFHTFAQAMAEFHSGNLDHFHSFLASGPRAAALVDLHDEDGVLVATPRQFEDQGFFRCVDAKVDALCVVADGAAPLTVQSIQVVDLAGKRSATYRLAAPPGCESGATSGLLVWDQGADIDLFLPQLDEVQKVEIRFAEPSDISRVQRVWLVSGSSHVILDRLLHLRDRFNFGTALVTEHSGLHFRSQRMAAARDLQLREYFEGHLDRTGALNGTLVREDGQFLFSTDADAPGSFARVLPALTSDFAVRFAVPRAATRTSGIAAANLIEPLSTRAGMVIYEAHRMLPPPETRMGAGAADDRFSRQDTFAARLATVLEAIVASPGLYWPIYTHLGAMPADHGTDTLPCPYLDADTMRLLQDRVFNITGSVAPGHRIWFARASSMYDYALIWRGVAGNARLSGDGTIEIASWHDPVLGKSLPRSASQLYGLTFYVDSPADARVKWDGRLLDHLTRNPPDETGRPSVTIAECGIRFTVFRDLDPGVNLIQGGTWQFRNDGATGPSGGRLTCSAAGVATCRIPMNGWRPAGAQLLGVRARRSGGARFAVVVETVTGERFFFGDRELLDSLPPPSASFVFQYDLVDDAWRTMTAPFHSLQWACDPGADVPMPSHALSSIALYCAGPAGAFVEFGELSFLRPRSGDGGERGFCMAGTVASASRRQAVYIHPEGEPSRVWHSRVDVAGAFCFSNLPPGLYRVWSDSWWGVWRDRRGLRVELNCNIGNLSLTRARGSLIQGLIAWISRLMGYRVAISG